MSTDRPFSRDASTAVVADTSTAPNPSDPADAPVSRPARYDRRRSSGPTVSVIVPTFNEAENIPLLIPRLREALADFDYEVIIVDDDSPDLTWSVAEHLTVDEPRFSVIRRTTDKGLSAAVLTGMNVAGGSVFVVMDGDLQHDPDAIPALVSKVIDDGVPVAVASRAHDDGSYGDFSPTRRFISWVGAQTAHLLLQVPVSDPMSGYFALDRARYEEVVDKVNPRGFKILLEFLARGPRPEVAEVGYRFGIRMHGETKLTGSVVVAYLLAMIELTVGRFISATFTAYSLVGMTGLAVRAISERAMAHASVGISLADHWAILAAIEFSIITNYAMNNVFTFTTRRHRGLRRLKGIIVFHLVSLYGLLVHAGATVLLGDGGREDGPWGLANLWAVDLSPPFIAAMMMALIGNYHLNATLTWPRRSG